jgi:CRP/FNR family transcriptional regulator
VYSIRFGTLKTEYCLEDGRQQVIGFHLPGEILGLDGIGDGHYQSEAIALEESEVCIIRYEAFEDLAQQIPALQKQFHRILSRELTQDQRHLLSLGSLRAEERLATFLLNLSQRLAARGYLNNEFDLRMSRVEIGSYLGIQIETVSRMLSRFAESGLIQIKQRHIKLIDMNGLYELAGIQNPERTTQIKPHCV